MTDDELTKYVSGPLKFRIFCTECMRMSPYVNSARPCPECGSSRVECKREVGDIDKTSPVPNFLQGIPLPEGVGAKEVKALKENLKGADVLKADFGKTDMTRISAGFKLLAKGESVSVSRDEMGEEF